MKRRGSFRPAPFSFSDILQVPTVPKLFGSAGVCWKRPSNDLGGSRCNGLFKMLNVGTKTTFLSTMVIRAILCIVVGVAVASLWPKQSLGEDDAKPSTVEVTRQLQKALDAHDSQKSVELLNQLIEAAPDQPRFYYLRGCENLRVGAYTQSVADFDRYLVLAPDRKESLWERGISCYFAGQFREGAEQFALYQNYHDQDVENSVWRYLCIAKTDGIEKARETLLPIQRDSRPGLMEAFKLYQGEASPESLLQAAKTTSLTGEAAAGYRFYTYLYVGLFYLAEDKPELARDVLALAADPKLLEAGPGRISRYMWDVAVIALREVKAELEGKEAQP